jgi:hypothetical protein
MLAVSFRSTHIRAKSGMRALRTVAMPVRHTALAGGWRAGGQTPYSGSTERSPVAETCCRMRYEPLFHRLFSCTMASIRSRLSPNE